MKEIRDKLNQLLLNLPRGIVVTSSWLHESAKSPRNQMEIEKSEATENEYHSKIRKSVAGFEKDLL